MQIAANIKACLLLFLVGLLFLLPSCNRDIPCDLPTTFEDESSFIYTNIYSLSEFERLPKFRAVVIDKMVGENLMGDTNSGLFIGMRLKDKSLLALEVKGYHTLSADDIKVVDQLESCKTYTFPDALLSIKATNQYNLNLTHQP